MKNLFFEHPVLNSPYEYPSRHWELDDQGQPTQRIIENRRRAEFITPIPKPKKRKGSAAQQQFIFDEGRGLSTKGGRSLLQGRGRPLNTLETEGQMLQRVMPDLMGMKKIVVLNDEAHHCYREKPGGDGEGDLKGDEKKEAQKNNEAARPSFAELPNLIHG